MSHTWAQMKSGLDYVTMPWSYSVSLAKATLQTRTKREISAIISGDQLFATSAVSVGLR